jgi:hypothetical protein
MGKYGHVFNKTRLKRGSVAPPPPPDPDPVIRFNPNFVLLGNETIGESATQRNNLRDAVIDIATATSNAVRPDIGANFSWVDTEDTVAFPGVGVYDWTNMDAMVAAATAASCKCWFKLFHRNYGSTGGLSSPIVPRYMQEGSTEGGLNSFAGTTGGTGNSANGEYEGVLGAGGGTGNLTRAAKFWVPEVVARFQAWLIAIGERYNDNESFAGVIINETAVLPAETNAITGMSIPTKPSTKKPTSDQDIMYDYFQNFFAAVVAARSSFSKCELMISANSPVAPIDGSSWTMYNMSPLNPSVLYTNHQIGNLVQDAYAAAYPTPKFAVRAAATNNQPYAVTSCSYASLLSPDVRKHKGVEGTEALSTTARTPGLGSKQFTLTTSKSVTGGSIVNIMSDRNIPATEVLMTGTITSPASGVTATVSSITCSITSFYGSGSRSDWEIGIGANYLPPHSTDEMVEYAVKSFTNPWETTDPWGTHSFAGSTHVFFQITTTFAGTAEGQRNFAEYVDYLKTTARRVNTTRPGGYPAA